MSNKQKDQASSDGSLLIELERMMERLRREDGCPWDRQQTHLSLRPYLLEETYEVLEAIDLGSKAGLQEELGDLLLQIVFHSQIAKEDGYFDFPAVIRGIIDKMIRRHPHVFADVTINTVSGVLENWEKIKQKEKEKEPESILDTVPRNLPALMEAEKVQKKAATIGFDWPDISGPLAKLGEEARELSQALEEWKREKNSQELKEAIEEEYGDLLFSLVNVARFLNLHPELALRRAVGKFRWRFKEMGKMAAAHDRSLNDMTLQEMDLLWERSKKTDPKPESEV